MLAVDFGVSAQLDKTIGKRNTFIGTPYWWDTLTGISFYTQWCICNYAWVFRVASVASQISIAHSAWVIFWGEFELTGKLPSEW